MGQLPGDKVIHENSGLRWFGFIGSAAEIKFSTSQASLGRKYPDGRICSRFPTTASRKCIRRRKGRSVLLHGLCSPFGHRLSRRPGGSRRHRTAMPKPSVHSRPGFSHSAIKIAGNRLIPTMLHRKIAIVKGDTEPPSRLPRPARSFAFRLSSRPGVEKVR
jgi:hypothetical protein